MLVVCVSGKNAKEEKIQTKLPTVNIPTSPHSHTNGSYLITNILGNYFIFSCYHWLISHQFQYKCTHKTTSAKLIRTGEQEGNRINPDGFCLPYRKYLTTCLCFVCGCESFARLHHTAPHPENSKHQKLFYFMRHFVVNGHRELTDTKKIRTKRKLCMWE